MKKRDKKYELKRIKLVERFETNPSNCYFDVEEFVSIIEYYIEYFDIESAEKALQMAFGIHPNNSELLLKQAEINFQKGEFRISLQCLEKYPNPNDSEMLFWKAKALVELGEVNHACEYFNRIAENENDDEYFDDLCFDIARAFHDEQYAEISISWLKKGYEFNKKNTYLINYYAMQCALVGSYKESTKLLNESLDLDPYQAPIWVHLCENLLKEGKHSDALKAIDFAVLLDKNNFIAWKIKGELLSDTKDFDNAINCFSKAKECAVSLEETSECFFLLADCFEQKGDFINALSCYQENIHWNKILGVKDSASFLGCAYSLLGLEKFEEALTLCEEISDVFPDIAEGWFYKGEAFYALNKIDEAEDCYLKALGMEENQESLLSILISLGNIYFGKEEFDQALINYNQAYLLKQDDDNIKLLISITSYKLNDKNKAFSLLKEVAKNKADAIQFFTNFCPESEDEIDLLLNK